LGAIEGKDPRAIARFHRLSNMRSPEDRLAEALNLLEVEVVRPLTVGGQKAVFLVRKEGRECVLKLVHLISTEPLALERARREVDLLAATAHPNVVRVESPLRAIGDPVDGAAWLEQFLSGTDVGPLFGQPWEEAEIVRLGLDVANGLQALHEQGVVHRDLSAGNVRRLDSGEYVVLDPGFAKHALKSGITVGGQPGTPGFMTPEHLHAYTSPTPASDVFAIGALMYAAATGDVPVPWRGDDADYVSRLVRVQHRPLLDARPDLSAELGTIIERALHPHPVRRYRNGAALSVALEELA